MALECGGTASSLLSWRRSLKLSPRHLSSPDKFSLPHRAHRFIPLAVVKRSPKRLKYLAPRFKRIPAVTFCRNIAIYYSPSDEEALSAVGSSSSCDSSSDGGLEYVKVDPSGSESWKLEDVAELLKQGAVGVIPTDTVYALCCDLNNNSAIERLRRIKDIEDSKPLSILCCSFHDIDTYTTGFPRGNDRGQTDIFRAVKHCLPGPYTFILTASKALPKRCMRYGTTSSKYATRKNVGVRIPGDPVCQAILEKMDAPLISTSVKSPKEDEWILDPVIIANLYGPKGLDFIVDAGIRLADPSTVVDMTGTVPRVMRQGKGPKQPWMVSEDEE